MPDESDPPTSNESDRPAGPPEPPTAERPWYTPTAPPPGSPPPWAASSPPTTGWSGPTHSAPPPIPPGPHVAGGAYGPPSGASGGPPRRRVGLALLAAVVALLIGAGGVAAGVAVSRNDDSSNSQVTSPVASSPGTTAVPPLKGDETEPAEAVAKVLGPAVVQIETSTGLGSGFVYDKSGLIMTASHVTDGAKQVQVRLSDGAKLEGRVLGEDRSTDVAVVKIDPPKDMTVATLATGVPTQVGQTAIAIGSPFGLDQTVTEGIVSAVGRSVQTPGGVIPAVQTDAPINSGNSGGALADRQGRVIGINDSIVTGSSTGAGGNTGNVGVGFAIPIEIAKPVANELATGKSPAAGFLGVEGTNATGSRSGAAITSVESGSPASKAGLSEGDVVTAVDDQPVTSQVDLAARIRTHNPGETITLTIERNGKQRKAQVTLDKAPTN